MLTLKIKKYKFENYRNLADFYCTELAKQQVAKGNWILIPERLKKQYKM